MSRGGVHVTCIMNPKSSENTSRGGFGGTGSIWNDSAVRTRFNWLGPDPWCMQRGEALKISLLTSEPRLFNG